MAITYNPNNNAVQISGVASGGPMAATITGCTAGNTLLCAVTFTDNAGTLGLPAPNAPPGWVIDSSSVVTGTIPILVVVYRTTAVAGTNTFSTAFVIGTSPFYWNGSLVEVTPLAIDKAPAPVFSATTSLTGPNTGTLSSANEFVFAVCGNDIAGTPVIPSLPTGFTSILASNNTNTNIGVRTAYQIVSATTAINPTWTVATGGTTFAAVTTYKEGAPAIVVQEAVISDHAGTARTTYTSNGFASAATVGSAIEVWIITSGTTSPTSVVDSAGQTYVLQQTTTYFSGFNRFSVYVKTSNASATTLAITVTWPSNVTYAAIWQREIKGVSGIQGSAINTQTTPGTSADAITSGTITPSSQPAFLSAVTVNTEQGTPAPPEAGTGFTSGTIGFFNAGTRSEAKSVTSLSAVAGTFTDATGGGSANQYATGAVLYTVATTTPTITVQPTNQSSYVGLAATFSVTATGATSYQWKASTPPVYNSATTYSLLVTGETSSSFSHTVGTASNRYLLVFLGRGTGYGTNPTSVTFGGVAMSLLATQQNASWGSETFVYGLMAPASGAGPVAVTWGTSTRGGIVAASFSNVNQTTANGTIATSITGSATVASSVAGLVVDIMDTDTGDSYPLVAGAGQTVLANFLGSSPGGTATQGIGISTKIGAASVTMSWTGWHTAAQIAIPLLSPVSSVSGATSSSYTTSTLAAANNGTLYYVDCINSGGTTTSNAAILSVSYATVKAYANGAFQSPKFIEGFI